MESFVVSEENDERYELYSEGDLNILRQNSIALPEYSYSEVSKESFNT